MIVNHFAEVVLGKDRQREIDDVILTRDMPFWFWKSHVESYPICHNLAAV